jgi:hypothetical protein
MEVDEKPSEDYSDIGGLDKQIQELVEAIVLPVTHKVQCQNRLALRMHALRRAGSYVELSGGGHCAARHAQGCRSSACMRCPAQDRSACAVCMLPCAGPVLQLGAGP